MKSVFGVGRATTTDACCDAPTLIRRKQNLENGFFGTTHMYRPQAAAAIPSKNVATFAFQAKSPEARFDTSVNGIV